MLLTPILLDKANFVNIAKAENEHISHTVSIEIFEKQPYGQMSLVAFQDPDNLICQHQWSV